ncbi:MAG: HEAT repeat domain-containing protein [Deltaproteobacteria bacterium]|nr:HEAT repeat domain-containing protein [Deltaproteobacteria bacterium]
MNVTEAVQKLSHDDEAERDRALSVLMLDKRGAIHALIAALKGPMAPKALPRMVLLLAAFEAKDAVPVLLDLLDKGTLDYDQRGAIARALGELVEARHAKDARLRRHALALSAELLAATRAAVLPVLLAIGDDGCDERLKIMAAVDNDNEVKSRARTALIELRNRRPPTPVASAKPASSSSSKSKELPDGAMAIDFAALMSSSSSGDMPMPPGHKVPEGGLAFDFEAMVKQQPAAVSSSSSSASSGRAAAPLDPKEALLQRLRDQRWTERAKAIEEVVARGHEMVPLLVERLGPDTQARMGICLALAQLQATEAASALLMVATSEARTSEERDVQAVALKALANCLTGTEEGVAGPLLPLLRSPDPFVRAGAVVCLGRLADRVGARAATLLLASDPDDEVRKAAAIAVSESVREDHEDLVAPLLATLTAVPRPPAEGQEAILIALARIEVTQVALKVRIRHRVRPLVFGVTASQRRLAITVLDRCYSDEDPPPVWVIEDVLDRTGDPSPETRLVAASFVARFLEPGFTNAVSRLEDALDRGERGVSLLVLDALHRHDTPLARAALQAVADGDPDEDVKARAQVLLLGFTPKSSEWSSSARERVDAEAPPAPRAPTGSGRVRPAGSSSDVVVAKDGDGSRSQSTFVDDVTRPLADRLAAIEQAKTDGRLSANDARVARLRILEKF